MAKPQDDTFKDSQFVRCDVAVCHCQSGAASRGRSAAALHHTGDQAGHRMEASVTAAYGSTHAAVASTVTPPSRRTVQPICTMSSGGLESSDTNRSVVRGSVSPSSPVPGVPKSPPVADSYQQGCIKMTLENADLWKAFHSIGTEMIITKHGRRMFPHCNISLSGLQPYANYVIMVDMVPVDSFRYKWNKEQWEVAGKAEPQPPCRTYLHPESPAMGSHWMKQALSFPKMKLTNNTLDQRGHIILHSMHRYYPRFHVIQADSPYTVRWGPFQTFSFPETSFTAVTAYQNPKITKLKIDHNPFAKGFREGGTHSHSKRCRSNGGPNSAAKRAATERKATCKSPSGLQRLPSSSQSVEARSCTEEPLKGGDLSPWAVEQDPSESLHAEPLELHGQDYGCEEQMVPASMTYQPCRSVEYERLPSPSRGVEDGDGQPSYESHVPDVATLAGYDRSSRFSLTRDAAHHQQHAVQNQVVMPFFPPASIPTPPKVGYSIYGHQAEQSARQWGDVEAAGHHAAHTHGHAPPHPHPHPLAAGERGSQQCSYHHHGNQADWSQYPLFSYSCW
ncbi:T-box-containing protein TBX6L-like [Myripristis murdjan]|uniref:T-box-containing protein TBX6L-like n=1 Tax=Myripristis murdjan TaxID=586833 RepID=UPI001175F29C|nr:T-box-containing protein TBX6L-like [Myripristis murdjan]